MDKETKDSKKSSKELTLVNNYDLGLDLVNNRSKAIEFFTDLLKGRKSGVTSPAEAMMVYGRCKELSLPFLSTIDHMAIIQGKVCADIHIKTALVLRAGNTLWWEKTKDYEPQYKYTDGTSEWISSLKPAKFLKELAEEEGEYAKTLQYCWDSDSTKNAIDAGKKPFGNAVSHGVVYDYVTEYVFYRQRRLIDGTIKTLTAKGSFSVIEGHIAKLGYGAKGSDYENQRDPNSNWGKYERRMISVRAFDNGSKEIASDLTMGMPEIGEMAEVAGMEYSFDENTGNASIHRTFNPDDVTDVEEIEDNSTKD